MPGSGANVWIGIVVGLAFASVSARAQAPSERPLSPFCTSQATRPTPLFAASTSATPGTSAEVRPLQDTLFAYPEEKNPLIPVADLQPPPELFLDRRPWLSEKTWWGQCWDEVKEEVWLVGQDYKNFYTSPRNLATLGIAIAIAAPLANTPADQNFRNWYQNNVWRPSNDSLAAPAYKFLGQWKYMLPVYAGSMVVGWMGEDKSSACAWIGHWGDRSMRAMALGAPITGVLQYGLGASRPEAFDSHWHPFRDNNSASGHAFVGSVPFLTAYQMSDNPWMKGLFFAGSLYTPWARVHQDSHYLSQAILGWAVGFVATQAVNDTEWHRRTIQVVPLDMPNGVGVGVHFQY